MIGTIILLSLPICIWCCTCGILKYAMTSSMPPKYRLLDDVVHDDVEDYPPSYEEVMSEVDTSGVSHTDAMGYC